MTAAVDDCNARLELANDPLPSPPQDQQVEHERSLEDHNHDLTKDNTNV